LKDTADMAKHGFTYYSVDTDRYQDIRIKRLKKELGCQGIAVYDYILCEIYRVKGCFLEWDESTAFDVAEYFGLKETLVKEIVRYCLAVGLFDRELLKCGSVLSSRSIQLRYVEMCGRTKRKPAIPQEYDLLDGDRNSKASGENSDFLPKTPRTEKTVENALSGETDENSEFPQQNSEFLDENSDKPPKTPTFFDKEKESKVKEEEKEEESPTAAAPVKTVPPYYVRSGLQPIDPLIDALKEQSMFTQYCMMSYHLKDYELNGYLDKFKSFLHATDEHEKTLKDCKTHFMNWLSLTLQRERKEREGAGGGAERREPTDDQAARALELYPSQDSHMAAAYRNYVREQGITPEKGLEHLERAKAKGMEYWDVLSVIQLSKKPLFKD